MSEIELRRRDCQQNTPSNDIEQQPDNIDFMAHGPGGQYEPSVEDRADSNQRVRCAPQKDSYQMAESCS